MLISPETLRALQEGSKEIILDPTQFTRIERAGKIHYRYNPPEIPESRAAAPPQKLPFQITATPALLRAEPGILAGGSIGATEQASPAEGDWYLEAKCVINTTTGAITSRAVAWVTEPTENTATDFHSTIGQVAISGGEIEDVNQYSYGPLHAFRFGAISEKWALQIY